MNEIISSILEAEKKAEEIVKMSAEKAKAIKQSADEEGEKIKNGAIAVFKLHRTAEIKSAEKRAASEYDAIIESGKGEIERIMKRSADKIEKFAEETVKDITD